MLYLADKTIDEVITDDITIVDFFATWCGPCMMLGEILEDFRKQNSDVKIIKVNTDECTEEAKKFGVMSIPTLFLYKNKKIIDKKIGFQDLEELNQWVKINK